MRVFLIAALVAVLAVPASAQVPADSSSSIVTVLSDDGRFTVLLDALENAGLSETLAEPGPFTLFAPTDSAFAALPEGVLASLTPDELQRVLLGHVVEGTVSSAAAAEAGQAPSAWTDRTLTFVVGGNGGLSVDGVSITEADIAAPNGVIHVVGAVLLPNDEPEPDEMDEDMDERL